MTTEQGQNTAAADTDRIEYRCERAGRNRRTVVEAEADGVLTPRDVQQGEAADAYPAARTPAEEVAEEARVRNDATLQDLRCDIDRDLRKKLNKVWKDLRKEIEEASPQPGCLRPSCDADESVSADESLAALSGRVARMRSEAADLDTCFGTLVTEQAALTQRVTAVKSDVDALADEVKNAAPDADSIPFYARARVLRWRLEPDQLWSGFTVTSYLACVNDTMDCLRRQWRAITVLSGSIAERQYLSASKAEKLVKGRAGVVDELLKRYQAAPGIQAPVARDDDAQVDDGQADGGQNEDPDRGGWTSTDGATNRDG